MADDEDQGRFRRLVRDHQVVYEVQRHRQSIEVRLYGTHGDRGRGAHIRPGCEHCQTVWDDLRAIAQAALSRGHRGTVFVTEGYRPALTYDPKRHSRADVELVLEIRDRDDQLAAVGPVQEQCLDELVAALRALGVREATWSRE